MNELQQLKAELIETQASAWREMCGLRAVIDRQSQLFGHIANLLGTKPGDGDAIVSRLEALVATESKSTSAGEQQ